MIHHDIPQNTDDWLDYRMGKITSSCFGEVMANEGNAFGDPAKDYALQLALVRITGVRYESTFTNSHMERGHEQEPLARMLYEDTFFCDVDNGGWFDCGNIGCSPDGLVGTDGEIEIKSVTAKVHYANVKRNNIDPTYKWQIYGNLKYTGRQWIDFVSFCDEYPVGKKLFVYRVHRSECDDVFARLERRLADFEMLVQKTMKEVMA
jgi:hypothetical protein